jgi:RNA polymerase sigma factor (sigma-70 family)
VETVGKTCAFMTGMVQPGAMAEVTTETGTSGMARSFERFFQDEYDGLSRALYLVTGSRTEAEDVAQEAMVRVFEHWDRVMSTRSPVGYLYRTALNLYRSRLRRAAVRLRRGTPETAHLDPIAVAEDRDELGRLLAALPDGQREALVLVAWLGMTNSEAGEVLGIEPVSVRVRVSRATAALRAGRDHEPVREGDHDE